MTVLTPRKPWVCQSIQIQITSGKDLTKLLTALIDQTVPGGSKTAGGSRLQVDQDCWWIQTPGGSHAIYFVFLAEA
jgi:hypothetical protein